MSRPLKYDRRQLVSLREQGLTYREIAERLGISRESAQRGLDERYRAKQVARKREYYREQIKGAEPATASPETAVDRIVMIISPWVEERIGPHVCMSRTVRAA